MIKQSGVYLSMSMADYYADPCPLPSLTQSIAKILIDRSPAHARLAHPRLMKSTRAGDDDEPAKYNAAQVIGTAAHALLIKRGLELLAIGDFDNWRTKEAAAFKLNAQDAKKTPILTKHMARAYHMVDAARAQLDAAGHSEAFVQGNGEVVVAWQEDDIWLRTMIDWITPSRQCVYDYKTTGMSCAPHVVVERPSEEGWDIQAAMHERALNAMDPDNVGRRQFFYIAQENDEPFGLVPIQISEADLSEGRSKLEYAIELWREAMRTSSWPVYEAATVFSQPRGYIAGKWLDRQMQIATRRKPPTTKIEPDLLAGG